MSYRQPRTPEYREEDGVAAYIRTLILFLKEFSTAAWAANERRKKEHKAIEKRIQALEEKAE